MSSSTLHSVGEDTESSCSPEDAVFSNCEHGFSMETTKIATELAVWRRWHLMARGEKEQAEAEVSRVKAELEREKAQVSLSSLSTSSESTDGPLW